jgi:hypothetical protein
MDYTTESAKSKGSDKMQERPAKGGIRPDKEVGTLNF